MADKAKNSQPSELIPEKDHKDVGRKVFYYLNIAVKDKEDMGLPDKWLRFYELGKNKHWRSEVASLSLVSANLIGSHRRRTVNTLTDNNPTFNVKKVSNIDEDRLKKLSRTVEFWWNETEQQSVLEKSVHNGETYGSCIEKVRFDVDAEYGIGEVVTEVVDPYHFALYPPKVDNIQKADVLFHYYPISIHEARRRYPDFAEEIVPDNESIVGVGEERRYTTGLKSSITRGSGTTSFGGAIRSLIQKLTGSGSVDETDEVLIVEAWVKDYSTDEEGVYIYPGNIRCITALNGHIVVEDRGNPSINPDLEIDKVLDSYLYDKFPFAFANSNIDTSNIWGESDVEQLAVLQLELNKALSQFSTLKDKVAGVKLINPKTSGVHNDKLKSSGASVINPDVLNHGIQYLNPPPIPRELIDAINMYREFFYLVSGSFDVEQANEPGKQVIAYKAIATLLERAATMARGKIRNYSKLVRERGRMYVSLAQNWYTEERYITYEHNGREEGATITGDEMRLPMRLSVVSGSTMPRSQVQQREEALTLYDKGAIDNEELLKRLDWPDYHTVIARKRAGAVNQFIDNLTKAGLPEEIAQYMSTISQIEDNKLERAIERYEIPAFTDMFQIANIQSDPAVELKLRKLQAEVDEILSRVDKNKMDAELSDAKATVELAGVEQAEQELKLKRAEIVKMRKDNTAVAQ